MELSKWELWPWNWRKVRKANISPEDRRLFECYGEAVIGRILAGETPLVPELLAILPHYDPAVGPVRDKFEEARNWLTECRDAHERRERRVESIEIGVIALITAEIVLSLLFGFLGLWEGWKQKDALDKQVTVLDQMNKNTADTAAQIQRAATSLDNLAKAQAESLRILQQQEADRAKKPTLALNVGRVPLFEPHATFTPTQETDGSVTYHLDLWNRGDVTANKLYFRALVSAKDVTAFSNPPGLSSEPDPTDSSVQAFISSHLFVRSHSYMPFDITFSFQKGHPPFQVTFKADSEEVRTPTFLGVLPVTPRTPSK